MNFNLNWGGLSDARYIQLFSLPIFSLLRCLSSNRFAAAALLAIASCPGAFEAAVWTSSTLSGLGDKTLLGTGSSTTELAEIKQKLPGVGDLRLAKSSCPNTNSGGLVISLLAEAYVADRLRLDVLRSCLNLIPSPIVPSFTTPECGPTLASNVSILNCDNCRCVFFNFSCISTIPISFSSNSLLLPLNKSLASSS